jgi:hypothetical protein
MGRPEKHAAPGLANAIDFLDRLFGVKSRRRPAVRAPGMEIDVGALRRPSPVATARRPPSLRNREQAIRAPDAAARAYLTVLAREPGLVAAALSSRGGGRAMRVSDLIAALDESAGQ